MVLNAIYHEFSPILHLYYSVGGLQFHQAYDNKTKTYTARVKIISWSTLYSLVVAGLQIYMVYELAITCSRNYRFLENGQKLNAISIMFNVFGPMVTPLFILFQYRRMSRTFEFWFEIQRKVEAVSFSEAELDLGTRRWCQKAMICTVLIGVAMATSNPILRGMSPEYLDIIVALGGFYGCMLFALYYASCKATWSLSHRVLKDYRELLEMNMKGNNTKKLDDVAMKFLPIWLDVNIILRDAGSSASLSLAATILINFELGLYLGYMLLSAIGVLQWDAFIFMATGLFLCWFTIFAVCSASQSLSCKVKSDFVEAIGVTKKLRASKPTIMAINKFLLRLIEISPPLNLDGYMTIDRSLLTTLISTCITITIVLMQLQIGNNTITEVGDILKIRELLSNQEFTKKY